jgi:DNA-binding transcriptional ArsR family regulator
MTGREYAKGHSDIKKISKILNAIQSPNALKILFLLITSDKRMCEISRISDQSNVTICQHVSKLKKANLIKPIKKNSANILYTLTPNARGGLKLIFEVLRTINDEEEFE